MTDVENLVHEMDIEMCKKSHFRYFFEDILGFDFFQPIMKNGIKGLKKIDTIV